jgi:hypothetical protein
LLVAVPVAEGVGEGHNGGTSRNPLQLDHLVALLIGAATFLALSPVWTTSFGFLDDYPVLWGQQVAPSQLRDLELLQGRPVSALLHFVAFAGADDVDDLTWVRAAGVACLAFVAAVTYLLMRRLGYGILPSWVMAVGLLWLPSTQVFASWSLLIVGSVTLALALLAAWRFDSAVDVVLDRDRSRRARFVATLAPIGLLTVAMCTYQSPAMFFWPMTLLILLAPRRKGWSAVKLINGALLATAVGAVACVAGYVTLRIGAAWVAAAYSRTDLVTDFSGKVNFLLHSALPRTLDPWALTPRTDVAIATGVFLAVALPVAVQGSFLRRAVALVLGLAALPLSYLPNIIAAENWPSSRSLAAAYVVPLAVAVIVLDRLPVPSGRVPRLVVLSVAVAVGTHAVYFGHHRVSTYFSAPQHRELALARMEVAPALADVRSPVVVVNSDWTQSLAPGVTGDEFGIPSTYAAWVPVGFSQLLAHEETGHWLPNVTSIDRAALGSVPSTTLIVDYGRLLDGIDNPSVYRGPMRP